MPLVAPSGALLERSQALERCENMLCAGLHRELEAGAFVGTLLSRIRVEELYRAAGCDSFQAYCRKILRLTREAVERFIELHQIVELLRGAHLELPANQTQALLLSKIPTAGRAACWRTILERCTREETVLSDAVVRRAVRFEIARESLASKPGVKVLWDFEA